MERQQTCEERIEDHKRSRLDSIGSDLAWYRAWSLSDKPGAQDRAEAAQERLWELPLSVETMRTVKVLLSTGGPADWIEATYREGEDEPFRISYHFADWFDHAARDLENDDFETAQAFLEAIVPS
jgi:hypothetical protein